ncbi:hypothetical protein H5410_052903 [Solanum commersonii]|uniref:Leucine-rich repeat-containing N-terminal plant-type domain-containing protein n=1 Tax=Solanum commersonii TaxID=4109 RepID=A0A9J5X4Q9_SOLCO|nr:hypothetical protein H5410_052903 [Solanum commersonii]
MKISLLQISFITILMVFLITSSNSQVYGQCLRDQMASLLKLKHELTFDSSMSRKIVRWNRNTDCCLWPSVSYDKEGHVLALELDNEAISGGVDNSSSLFDLQHLEKLNLAYNDLRQIPVELSRLTKLVVLDISTYNDIVGFPYSLLSLESPDLGTLVGSLANLRELYLDGVNVSLKGSEWCSALSSSLPLLRVLSMRYCEISGPIDPVLVNLPFLSVIRLDMNNLSTMVPDFLADFTKLTTLSVRWCNLFGPFPSKIFQIPTLQQLDLLGNVNLTSTLPEFPHKNALRELSLRETSFTGLLPNSIANLRSLITLDLYDCNFRGPIPSTMGNLTNLVSLDLSNNNFTGSIPLFHEANKLNYIDISNNNGQLSSAQTQLAVLLSLPSLQYLYLYNSHLSGEIHEFPNVSSSVLETLYLSNNHLNGSIPRSIFKLNRLSQLSLSSNSFSGTINIEAVNGLPRLTTLDLSDNKIEGEIPNWIWTVAKLNLSHNLLESVEKPYYISTTSIVIDLSFNRIKGNPPFLPDRFANWKSSITYFSIANNQFTGSISSSICSLDQLQFLDMSNNSINGKIPPSNSFEGNTGLCDLPLKKMCSETKVNGSSQLLSSHSEHEIEGKYISFALGTSVGFGIIIWLLLHSQRYNEILDRLLFRISNISPVYGQCLGDEKALLLKLKKSFTFDSSKSTKLVRWDLNTDCCLWPGVSCDQEGHVLVLDLDDEVITSGVPEFIANFTKLTTLSLRNCKLRGSFPSKIIQVQTLQELYLSFNVNLTGTLPEFSQKSALREVVLSYTGFTGSLSDSIANLRNLTRLDLAGCNFSGDIPSKMGNLTDLVHLDLSFNSFTGSIPLFHKAKKLNYIDLSNNNGPFSSTQTQLAVLLSLPSLQFLSVQNSRLSGVIHEFSNASSSVLDTLDLSNNYLNGSIPRSIFQLKSLSELVLSSNSFNGTINLEAIGGLPRLNTLDLSYNNLRIVSNSTSFPFPAKMHHLRLASCQLQKFPDLKNQSFLFELDLSDNKIRGGIPNWVWKVGILNLSHNLLESLEKPYYMSTTPLSIDLSCNRIKGNPPFLPPDSAAIYHRSRWAGGLTFLSLANNEFTGSIPSFTCNLNQLQFLDIETKVDGSSQLNSHSEHEIDGKYISFSLGSSMTFGIVTWLLLHSQRYNELVDGLLLRILVYGHCLGDRKALLLKLKNGLTFDSSRSTKLIRWNQNTDCCQWPYYLEKLNLAYNYLNSVQIPTEVYKLTNLAYLNLSYAGFGGQIPMELSRLTKLTFLDISNVELKLESGDLKTLVGNLPNLRELHLDESVKHDRLWHFKPFDPVLLNLHFLSVIRLDDNNLSTIVPEFLANFPKLTTLSLSNCNLRGEFPNKILQVPTLQELDLYGDEKLSGNLPDFSQNGSLREVVLGFHELISQMHSSLIKVTQLSILTQNGLKNPTSLFDLQYLEKLNLAYNHLNSVQIPREVYKLTNLTYLNLSFAGVGGRIPMELSRLTKLMFLDLSNVALKLESRDLKTLVGNLPNLRELYLDEVYISWKGIEWCSTLSSSLPQLRVLNHDKLWHFKPFFIRLDDNNLSTIVPEFLANFPKLTTLSLSNCNLRGEFSNKILQVPTLQELDLYGNEKLSGTLPDFSQNGSLRELVLGFHELISQMHSFLRKVTQLSILTQK